MTYSVLYRSGEATEERLLLMTGLPRDELAAALLELASDGLVRRMGPVWKTYS